MIELVKETASRPAEFINFFAEIITELFAMHSIPLSVGKNFSNW